MAAGENDEKKGRGSVNMIEMQCGHEKKTLNSAVFF